MEMPVFNFCNSKIFKQLVFVKTAIKCFLKGCVGVIKETNCVKYKKHSS